MLIGQIARYIPGSVIPAVVGALFAVIFTRLLTAGEFGRYSLAVSSAVLVSNLTSQWLVQGANRYLPGRGGSVAATRLKGGVALGVVGILAALTVLGLGLAAADVAGVLQGWESVVWAGFALAVATALFNILGGVMQAQMQATRYSRYQVVAIVGRLALAVLLVYGVSASASSLLWAAGVGHLAMLPFMWRDAGIPSYRSVRRRWRRLAAVCGRLARYGVPMVGWIVAATLLDAGDRYIIQLTRGAAEVGIYAANYNLVTSGVGLAAMPVLLAAHPFLMRAWQQGDPREAARWLGTIVEWFLVAGAVLVGMVALFAEDAVMLLLGDAFYPGYRIVPIVLAGQLIWQAGLYAHKPLEFVGKTRTMLGLSACTAVLNLALNLAFVPRFGYLGAAYTTVVSYLAYTLVAAWLGRRALAWGIRWRLVASASAQSLGAVAVAAAVRAVVEPQLGYVAALLIAGMIALAANVWVVRRVMTVLMARAGAPAQ